MEIPKGVNIEINVDTSQIDEALKKAKELVTTLKSADETMIKIESTKLDGKHVMDGSIDMSGLTSKDEVSEDENKRVLVTFQVEQVVERVTVVVHKEADFTKYLDDKIYIEGSYACFYKEDGKPIAIKASSIVSVEEL